MPLHPKNWKENSVYGGGRVYIALHDDDGNPTTAQRFLGNVPSFTLSSSAETHDLYASWGPSRELLESVSAQRDRTGTFTCTNMSPENVALFIAGEATTISQASATGESEDITVSPGFHYQLGVTDDVPTGVLGVSNVTVAGTSGSTTYEEGKDYVIDEDLGRIEITSDSTIDPDTEITISYDVDERSYDNVSTTESAKLRAALYFIADNSAGKNRNIYMPNVTISPDGDWSMITEADYQTLSFSIKILPPVDGVGEAVQYYG